VDGILRHDLPFLVDACRVKEGAAGAVACLVRMLALADPGCPWRPDLVDVAMVHA
jgi:hypothetical protein